MFVDPHHRQTHIRIRISCTLFILLLLRLGSIAMATSALSSSPSSSGNSPTSSSSSTTTSPKIYLHTFRPVPHVYSVSPFAIKLESFLRINQIPYEVVYSNKFGSKGMIPYIRLDDPQEGKEITDSNVVIKYLLERQCCDEEAAESSESHLSPEQRATTHMLLRMLEEHTIQLCFYFRYGLHMEEFLNTLEIQSRFPPGIAEKWLQYQPNHTQTKTKMRGLSRHTDEELWDFSNDDIQSISNLLGNKRYIFGNDKPSLVDCAVFGHLSQFLWIPINFPQKNYMENNCPNIVEFMNRFKSKYWKDWDELCSKIISE